MSPLRILYVEDNADLRETVGMLIEGPGREVVLCASGEDATRETARRHFDIVFTDVRLPGISGLDLARQLLKDHPQQQVVLCSGEDLGPAVDALGPTVRWLTKPFGVEELDAVLDEVFPGS
ncbi:MAG: response regulator [Burkholderiales bacterium]